MGSASSFRRCGRERRRRVDRRLIPVAAVLVGGAVAAGVLLSRGSSGSAQASTGVAPDSVFNAGSGKPVAQAPVKGGPSAIAVGKDAVWVANVDDGSVSRIDLRTNASVDTIPVGKGPADIATGGGFVWVANGLDGTVSKIDPNTNTPVQTISVGNGPSGVAFGEGAVWVANSTDRTVTRIDPRTGKPGREIPAPAGADANNLDGTVSRIDPATNRQTSVLTVGDGPSGVAVTPDGKTVWVSSEIAAPCRRSSPTGWPPLPTALRGRR